MATSNTTPPCTRAIISRKIAAMSARNNNFATVPRDNKSVPNPLEAGNLSAAPRSSMPNQRHTYLDAAMGNILPLL
eukprot:6792106-Prymnesium_polylepis.1